MGIKEPNITLTQKYPQELDEQDLTYLVKAVTLDYAGVEPIEILQKPHIYLLLKIEGDAEGIMILEKVRHNAGLEVRVYGLAGKQLVLPFCNLETILTKVLQIAKLEDARWLGAMNIHPSLDRVYSKFVTRLGTQYLMEI